MEGLEKEEEEEEVVAAVEATTGGEWNKDGVGRIAPCVLNGSIIMILYHGTMEGLGIQNNENRGRLMPGLNNTPSRGYSHESNAIYLEEIHSELTEFYTSQLFLILTDHGNVVSKCQVWVTVGLRPPAGLGKI